MSLKKWLIAFCVFFTIITEGKNDAFGGENKWTVLKKNVFKRSLDVLVVDPSNPNVLYASVGDTGVLKSVDGGKHWQSKNDSLRNLSIQKIVIDPFKPKIIYACTKGGLYRSSNAGDQWDSIGFEPDTTVNAVAMVQTKSDTLYAAVGADIYRSQDGGKSWLLIPDTIHAKILALVVSRVNTRQLYIGTDIGIYQIQDDIDSIKVLRGPDEWEKRTTDFVVVPYRTTQLIFAILASGGLDTMGVYWAEEGKIRWRKMNEGIESENLPLLSLCLNSSKHRTLYAVTQNAKVLAYDFAVPEIGVLDFKVAGLSDWEIGRISRYIANKLNETHSVKWLSKVEVEEIAGPKSDPTDSSVINTIKRLLDFEMVISGEIRVGEDSVLFKPKIVLTTGKDTSINPVQWSKEGYYPGALDKIVERIYEKIDKRKHRLVRTVWQGHRKWLWLGPLGALAMGYGIRSLLDDTSPSQAAKLPYPPKFP